MAATITQNLPGGVAKTARPAGRQKSASSDQDQASPAFDATLKQSVDRANRRRDQREPAETPASEAPRSDKPDRSRRTQDKTVEKSPDAGNPSPAQVEQTREPAAADLEQLPTVAPTADEAKSNAEVDAASLPSNTKPALAATDGEAAALQSKAVPAVDSAIDSVVAIPVEPEQSAAPLSPVAAAMPTPSEVGAIRGDVVSAESELGAPDQASNSSIGNQSAASAATAGRSGEARQQLPVGQEESTTGDASPESLVAIAPAESRPDTPNSSTALGDSAKQLAQVGPAVQAGPQKVDAPSTPAATPAPQQFAEVNHPQIASAIRGQLLPNGGSMQIRLDPPEMGALLVQVTVRNGVIDASFQTSNPEATQALSHSLTQLKHSLESHGVTVDKLQVSQAARSERSDTSGDQKNNPQQSGQQAFDWERHSDQQRKEMLKRMWAKLGAGDPLDLVA